MSVFILSTTTLLLFIIQVCGWEDIIQQQISLKSLELVTVLETVAFVVHQVLKSLCILPLLHLQMIYYHIHRQLLLAPTIRLISPFLFNFHHFNFGLHLLNWCFHGLLFPRLLSGRVFFLFWKFDWDFQRRCGFNYFLDLGLFG